MNTKDWIVIGSILLASMLIAVLLNVFLSIDGFIPSAFSKNEWFEFWTTYTTGVFALIIGYLVISFGNKNSEQLLQQHNSLILRQESDGIKGEIAEEIKCHNRLFNVFDHYLMFNQMNHDSMQEMNVVKDRARLNECCINWNFLKLMYLSSGKVKEFVDEYDRCWNRSVEVLDGYLKIQLDLLMSIQKANLALQSMNSYDKQYLFLKQQKDSANYNDAIGLDAEILEAANGRDQQKRVKERCNKEIAEFVKKLIDLQKGVLEAQNILTTASSNFLSKLNALAFLRNE